MAPAAIGSGGPTESAPSFTASTSVAVFVEQFKHRPGERERETVRGNDFPSRFPFPTPVQSSKRWYEKSTGEFKRQKLPATGAGWLNEVFRTGGTEYGPFEESDLNEGI